MTTEVEARDRRKVIREVVKASVVLALLILMMLWLSGFFIEKVEPGPPTRKPLPQKLTTFKAAKQSFPLVIEQSGSVGAQTEAQVSTRIMAQVKEILVREGDRVVGPEGGSSATILARLDDRDILAKLKQAQSQVAAIEQATEVAKARLTATKAQVQSARANREKVVSDYRRYVDLERSRAATGQQLEHARAQKDMIEAHLAATLQEVEAAQREISRSRALKEQAEAAVAEARAMLDYAVIRAPFSGRVTRKMASVGDMASPGQPLFYIETSSRPELHAFLSESLVPFLKIGQEIDVSVEALNKTLPGTLREIIPHSDPSTRTVLVKVSLPPEPGLTSGLFGRLGISRGSYEALVVPEKAVREVGQLYLVDVLDAEGYPQRRFVTLGKRHDGFVEALSGLNEGEEVVLP